MATAIGLPDNIKYNIASWNSMTHGNVTFVIVLLGARYVAKSSDASYNDETWLLLRLAWFAGVGRTRYYYGQKAMGKSFKSS